MAKVYRSHFGSSCIILPHPPTPIPVSREEAWKVYLPPASTLDPSGGRGPGLGGTRCPRKHVPPPQIFLDGAGAFPLRCLSPGVFLPFGLLPPTGLVPFSGKGKKGTPPFLRSPLRPRYSPYTFRAAGNERSSPPARQYLYEVGLRLHEGCTTVAAATLGGGAAAPSELRSTRDPFHETPRLRDGADCVCPISLYRARKLASSLQFRQTFWDSSHLQSTLTRLVRPHLIRV